MLISTKGRYGLRSMADLVLYAQNKPVPLRAIAERQGISESYLEQVFALLRKAGLVNAIRGSYGGYVLSKPPEKITVGEIILALEGPLVSVNCVTAGKDASCDKKETCHTQFFWKKLSDQIMEVLSSTTLQDLLGQDL